MSISHIKSKAAVLVERYKKVYIPSSTFIMTKMNTALAVPYCPVEGTGIGDISQLICINLDQRRMLPSATGTQDIYLSGSQLEIDAMWFRIFSTAFARLVKKPEYMLNDGCEMPPTANGNKLRQFIEVVKGEDGVMNVGVRIWIINRSQVLDFNLGIFNLMTEVIEDCEKAVNTNKSLIYRMGEDFKQLKSIDRYKSELLIYDRELPPIALRIHQVTDAMNDYALTNIFSMETAFRIQHPYTNELQGNISSYRSCNGAGDVIFSFPKPHLVRELNETIFTPSTMLSLTFPVVTSLSDEADVITDYGNDIMSQRNIVAASDNPTPVTESNDHLSELKCMANQNSKEWLDMMQTFRSGALDSAEKVEIIRTWKDRKIMEFGSLWGTARHVSESLIAMFQWHVRNEQKVLMDKELDILSYSRPMEHCKPIDKELSLFGNFFVRRMNYLKHPYNCSTNHMVVSILTLSLKSPLNNSNK